MAKTRNEVFNAPSTDETLRGTPGVTTQELDFEIPVETVPIPSRGMAYVHSLRGEQLFLSCCDLA